MLIVAPIGSVKLATLLLTPTFDSAQRIVTGSVAELLLVEKAINSALAQSVEALEVIVIDDGSRDRSIAVVEAYDNPRVRLLKHAQNKGISGARNTGITAAQGAFIAFLDQDDYWYPDRVETALRLFDSDPDTQIGIVFGNEETRVLDTGELVRGRVSAPANANTLSRTEFLCALLQRNFLPTAAAMFRRECFDELGLLDETVTSGIDDFDMFLRVARRYDVRHVDKVQCIRHVHAENYTKLSRMIPDCLKVLDRIAAEEPAVARIAHRARSHYLYLLSREQHGNREYFAAIQTLTKAIKARPSDPKCWAALLLTLTGPIGHALTGAGRGQMGQRA
jgi:glycosyltransferase involved in cell wall biosynthesis